MELTEVKILLLGFIIGAFSYITALSWNSTLQKIFDTYFKKESDNLHANVVYDCG